MMNKILLAITFLFVVGCASTQQTQQAIAPNDTEYPSATPSIVPTETPIPTATIDYQSTAVIAQQTADEARRVNAEITAEFEKRLQEQIMVTAEHERNVMQIYSWTAQAEPTYIPLTATQQAFLNSQIPIKQTMISDQLTATEQAPTQLVAMIDAENYQRYGGVEYKFRIFGIVAISLFALCAAIYMLRLPVIRKEIEVDSDAINNNETIIHMKDTNDGGYRLTRVVIPCSAEQLTELAEAITQGKKTLAINQWEGRETLWKRDVILRFRGWLRDKDKHGGVMFALPTEDGQLAPTNEFLDFLFGWLENRKLPDEYEFKPQEPENQVADLPYKPQISHVTDL